MNLSVHKPEKRTVSNWLLRLLQGALVGVGAILPGISGGVMCVSFGLYQPIMAVLAHPKLNLKKHFGLLLPVGIGGLIGFFALAWLVQMFFHAQTMLATCLFFGLIVGTCPGLYRQSGQKGRTKGDWLAFSLSFFLLSASFWTVLQWANIQLQPGFLVFILCGALLGLGVVVPGLASSSILISLGIYQPVMSGIADLNFSVLVPMGIGVVGVLILAARFVNRMFDRHFSKAFHVVLGVVASSLLAVLSSLLPFIDASSVGEIMRLLGGAALAVGGFGVAMWMTRLETKLESDSEGS